MGHRTRTERKWINLGLSADEYAAVQRFVSEARATYPRLTRQQVLEAALAVGFAAIVKKPELALTASMAG